MKKYLSYILLAAGLLSQTACLSPSEEIEQCYSVTLSDKDQVHTQVSKRPHFKGGHDSLVSFLTSNINFERFRSNFSQIRTFHDTARIKFIVNKQGGLVDLSITQTEKEELADEISRVIKKSSCNWVAGETDKIVNSWHQFDLFFSVDQVPYSNEVQTRITINDL